MDTSGHLPLWGISMDNLWSDMSLFDSDIEGELEVLHYKNFGHHLYVILIKIIFLYDTLLEVYIFKKKLSKHYIRTIFDK